MESANRLSLFPERYVRRQSGACPFLGMRLREGVIIVKGIHCSCRMLNESQHPRNHAEQRFALRLPADSWIAASGLPLPRPVCPLRWRFSRSRSIGGSSVASHFNHWCQADGLFAPAESVSVAQLASADISGNAPELKILQHLRVAAQQFPNSGEQAFGELVGQT